MTSAAIEIGTNSIKLLVMKGGAARAVVLADRNEIARLGEGAAASGRLSEAAMERAVLIIADMADRARSLGCEQPLAIATQALRAASNAEDFKSRVKRECGVDLTVISGEEEADLSFRAVLSALPGGAGRICAFDVGGGSSEIVTGSASGVAYRRSVPVGALSLHDEFFSQSGRSGPVLARVLEAAAGKVRMALRDEASGGLAEIPGIRDAAICGVGGTITTLAAVALSVDPYDVAKVSGTRLSINEIQRQIEMFAATSVPERARIRGLNPKRADIILAGACIVAELLGYAGAEGVIVLDRGVRYGVMEKYFNLK
ncbi:MAG: Ppx/GppA family phosphatase [Synergistaceae bacterium]|jgi:exopolyphosphatase/guanosine-5'-triphosphate,3'-diphosphate pyrophosphatase|nr:Ppx/GppA family phosphatase [Synergistaceae bacterium]